MQISPPLDARITSTATVTRNGHPFCDVKGYISPVTQFEALLPTETWRGDYLQQGCGGLCGKADVSLDDPSRTSGYQAPYAPLQNGEMVVAADDQGHEAPSNARRALGAGRPPLRAVFGYSSEHQLARAMKAIVRAFMAASRPIPISAASPTAGTKRWSWRSVIRPTSTASSPARPPTTGRRSSAWSRPGSPPPTGTHRAGKS